MHAESLSVALVGIGAVGSMLATGLSRMGVRDLLLIDHERLEPGNLVRHEGLARQVEFPKALALQELISPVFARQRVRAKYLDIRRSPEVLVRDLRASDLVLDATGDPGVHELLGRSRALRSTRLGWVYIKPGPRFGLLALRTIDAVVCLGDYEESLSQGFDRWKEFADADRDAGVVWPEPGCYHPTFNAPYHRVRMMADGFLSMTLDWLSDPTPSPYACIVEQSSVGKGFGFDQKVVCSTHL